LNDQKTLFGTAALEGDSVRIGKPCTYSRNGDKPYVTVSVLDRIIHLLTKGSSGCGRLCENCGELQPAFEKKGGLVTPVVNSQATARQVLLQFGLPPNYRLPLPWANSGAHKLTSLVARERSLGCDCSLGGEVYVDGCFNRVRSTQEIEDLRRQHERHLNYLDRKHLAIESLKNKNDILVVAILLQWFGDQLDLPHVLCALKLARGLLSLLRDSGFHNDRDHEENHRALTRFLIPFLRHHLQFDYLDYIKAVKWWSTTLLAKHLRQVCEPKPLGTCDLYGGLRGSFRMIMRNRCASRPCKRTFHFFSGLQQLKRAANVVPDSFIDGQYTKHALAMAKLPVSRFDIGVMRGHPSDRVQALQPLNDKAPRYVSVAKIACKASKQITRLIRKGLGKSDTSRRY